MSMRTRPSRLFSQNAAAFRLVLGAVFVIVVLGGAFVGMTFFEGSARASSGGKAAAASAAAMATGSVSGLPIPRFVSLKSDRVNVRRGPATDHEVEWIYTREGLPVEITAEWDNWRRVRDADGASGWVFHSLLSGRRTAQVAPWSKDPSFPLHSGPSDNAGVVARLQPRVLAQVDACDGQWCKITGKGFEGWMEQDKLWGVYPGEQFDD